MKNHDWLETDNSKKKNNQTQSKQMENQEPDQSFVGRWAALHLRWFLSSNHDHNLLHEYGESNCKKWRRWIWR